METLKHWALNSADDFAWNIERVMRILGVAGLIEAIGT